MIGVHRNAQGTHETIAPVGEYVARLRDAGLRAFVVVIGEGGHAAQLADAGALVAFAIDSWRAAPAYDSGDAQGDAARRWETIQEMIPVEIAARRDGIWLIILNEPDKERAPYVFAFILRIAQLANADGYKVCGPNYSAGTPEVDAWETPEGLAWLRYCGENPDKARVAAHEYSLDTADIRTGYPWLVGRFQFVQDVCEDHGIPQPKWLIAEFGWSYESMPDPDEALRQLTEPHEGAPSIVDLYDGMEVALWTLGGWSQGPNLPPKLAAFMPLLTDWLIANVEPPDEEPPVNPIRELWEQSVQFEKDTGINFNPKFAFIKWAADNGYSPVHRERAMLTSDGARWNAQAFRDLRGEKPRVMAFYEQPWGGMGKVQFVTVDDLEPEPGPEPPPPAPEPFGFKAWPTAYGTVTQTFGARPDYYGQFGLPGHEGIDVRSPNGTPVYAVDDGIVYLVTGNEGNYGRQIRIDHGEYKSVYAHNLENMVQVGQRVIAGQQIARADSTGNSSGSHLHLTLKRDGHSAPGYPSNIIDPTPYIMPHRPDWPGLPPSVHGLTVCDVSQHQGAVSFSHMMRRGVYGCYIRGSIGGSGLDDRFATNWQNIKDTSMLRGMYHLFRSDSTAEQNLANIVKVVNEHGGGDLRIAIDVEPLTTLPRIDGDRVKRLLELFRDAFGYSPIVYTGLWVQDRVDGDKSWFASSLLWLASYWQAPPQVGQYPQLPLGGNLDRLLIHQFTSSYYDGRAFGVQSSGLDVNIAYNLDHLLVGGKEPDPIPDPPPEPLKIDMLSYLRGDGRGYMVQHPSGNEEKFRTDFGDTHWKQLKNRQWEQFYREDGYIWRSADTSAGDGNYYRQFEEGKEGARWCKRAMTIGETFTAPVQHTVQTYRKSNCAPVDHERNGQATNRVTLVALHASKTWNGITIKDVIELRTHTSETMYFARGWGLVAWDAPWGNSAIVKVLPEQEWDNEPETGCYG